MSEGSSNGAGGNVLGNRSFSDDGAQDGAVALVEGTIESQFVAERFSVDTVFEALAHPGRRYVLTYVLRADTVVSLTELIDYVETQTEAPVDEEFRRKITLELTHTVLPKLEELGFVEYDMERQLVEPTEWTPIVEPYLRVALAQQEQATERREE